MRDVLHRQSMHLLVVPVCLLLFSACSSLGAESHELPGEPVSFTSLQSANDVDIQTLDAFWLPQGDEDMRHRIYRDEDAFAEFWTSIHGDHDDAEPVPEVDFTEQSVFVLMLGERPSTGYSVRVQEVTEADGMLHVRALERTPGNCISGDAITYPYTIVSLNAVAEEASVAKEERARQC